MGDDDKKFGVKDNSFQAAGGSKGLMQLSRDFYETMESLPEAKEILEMHPENLEVSIEKLALFLSGWLGGPRVFQEKYGSIHIPKFHSHLKVGESQKEAWLTCMKHAIAKQNYDNRFSEYLLTQLRVPAQAIQRYCAREGS